MAEERREAQDAQAMKMRLKKNFTIEEQHTFDSNKTPGFGIETPTWAGSSTHSRMSPLEAGSVASSGVVSPMAGGQMSPWLLEAEALVNDEDNLMAPAASAWGFEPSRLPDVPEVEMKVPQRQEVELDELNDIIDDGDELEKADRFLTGGLVESPSTRDSDAPRDSDGHRSTQEYLGADSMASTATSPGPFVGSRKSGRKEQDGSSPKPPLARKGSANQTEYAVGDKVSYWSGSRGVWLAAVIVERKSSSVYLIDKQMKGCYAKVRASELISAAEEASDPVLRALAAFEAPSGTSPATSPRAVSPRSTTRASNSGTPRSSTPTPRRDAGMGNTRGPAQRGSREAGTHRENAAAHRKGEALAGTKAPIIRAELPPALAGAAGPASQSPRLPRGKIVRDDFSDDSDDD
jgi:hypothetical protein